MAPISDKRAQPSTNQSHLKEGGHHSQVSSHSAHAHSHSHGHSHSHNHHGHHSKENASGKHYKSSLEILDFHESWLQEMEYYKEQACTQKHQQSILPAQQQLLGPHNHLHTTFGCHIDGHSNVPNSISQNINAIISAASCMDAAHQQHVKRRSTENTRSRNTVRSNIFNGVVTVMPIMQMQGSQSSWAGDGNKQTVNEQLPLKRARQEDALAIATNTNDATCTMANTANSISSKPTATNITKRHRSPNHSHNAATTSLTKANGPAAMTTIVTVGDNAAKSGNTISNTNANNGTTTTVVVSSSPNKSNKIIVNPFHASTLLSAHQQEDKAKILTQNGLTKTAATAYETSLYASNYLPQDKPHAHLANRIAGGTTVNSETSTNLLGVYLAKNNSIIENGDSPRRHSHRHNRLGEDDPCAAIDAVTDYSDTDDSDDEYKGDPFFLECDGTETEQSTQIHIPAERCSSNDSFNSEEESCRYYKPKCILSPSIFPNVPPYLNFSSHVQRGPAMPTILHRVLKWKLSPVMPKIVKRVVLNSGFRIIKNTTDWMAIWEKHMKSPGFRTIRSHQKYNHMPGSFRIGRKDSMWRSIYNNVKKYGNKEFGFMQKSYIMPEDLETLRQVWPKNASKLTKWIVKPPASARGTGIKIVNKWSQFPKDRPLVVQKYVERPLLINDNKFDMRLYVVLTSINPLRIYMYKDGLARFASVKYSSELNSLDDRCMHLTNYSINKFSQNYSKNEDFNACQGHKWTLQSLWSCLEKRGVDTKRLWATLRNLVIKAIVSGESGLNRMYRQNVNFRNNCFELFGFDVLLDENITPWLLEINISPSLHSELPLDLHVKGPLIQAVLNTALYQVPPKLTDKQQRDILHEFKLKGPLCYDKRLFTTVLTADEVRKHNQFTSRSIEFREEYTDAILDNLLPDDVRCLVLTEDEFARCKPLERIFPTPDTHVYLKYIENPRYYNRLLDAWEFKYGNCREKGIELLSTFCKDNVHLQVSDAALEKEPEVALTEIDMLHAKKSDERIAMPISASNAGDLVANVDKQSKVPTVILASRVVIPPAEAAQQCAKDTTTTVRGRNATIKAH